MSSTTSPTTASASQIVSQPSQSSASQIVSQPSPSSTTPTSSQFPSLSPQKSSSTTHVQTPASLLRASRSNEAGSIRPRPLSLVSTSSGVHHRFMDAIGGSLTRQLSIASASDVSSIAMRRNPQVMGGKHSREPLLPIRVIHMSAADAAVAEPSTPPSATSNTGKVRSSLEKIFKRGTSADSIAASSKASPRPSSRLAKLRPTEADVQQPRSASSVTDSYFPPQPHPRSASPTSPMVRHPAGGFTAMPPLDTTPFVPYISPKTGKPERNYVGYPSRNTFFFQGHLLTGGDSPLPFIASFVLVLGLSGTWFGTTCVWWWHNESPAVAAVGAYVCLITVASMLATALRDPGILPRGLDPEPPYPAVSPSDGSPRLPFPRDLRVGDTYVRVKYCTTCKTYRPPRSSHCKACDNCIDGCDHHCQWVNNCIGRRNYTSFITFLLASSLALALVIVTAALHLFILTHREHVSFRTALSRAPGSAVVFSLGIVVIWPLLALMGFHVRLLLLNITTIEQVRNKFHATLVPGPTPPNPFSLGRWYHNVAYLLCRPAGYTWIEASAVKMEDQRQINPGAYMDWDEEHTTQKSPTS